MALTVANVSHPNQNVWEGEFLGQKARVIDVTFDNSYPNATGEVITAASLGFQQIYGCLVLQHGYSGTTTDLGVVVLPVVASSKANVALRVLGFDEDGGTNWEGLQEAADTTDLSAYSCRICVIGV